MVAIFSHRQESAEKSVWPQIPENKALEGLAGAMLEAWQLYNRPRYDIKTDSRVTKSGTEKIRRKIRRKNWRFWLKTKLNYAKFWS
jgi:hypothetical protein